jgi:hypothetical protein
MTLSQHQQAFSRDIAKLILFANALRVNLTFGEAWRSHDQQALYFYGKTLHPDDGGLELINAKKRSRTLDSKHLKRLAIDFNFFIKGQLFYKHSSIDEIGKYWESLSPLNRWGGNFKIFYDAPHFERNI